MTHAKKPPLGVVIVLVVCIKLSFFPRNCCHLTCSKRWQAAFFLLLAVQLIFSGPIRFFRVVFCFSSDSSNAKACEIFTNIINYVPYLDTILCSCFVHFWVSASWTRCCSKCKSQGPPRKSNAGDPSAFYWSIAERFLDLLYNAALRMYFWCDRLICCVFINV